MLSPLSSFTSHDLSCPLQVLYCLLTPLSTHFPPPPSSNNAHTDIFNPAGSLLYSVSLSGDPECFPPWQVLKYGPLDFFSIQNLTIAYIIGAGAWEANFSQPWIYASFGLPSQQLNMTLRKYTPCSFHFKFTTTNGTVQPSDSMPLSNYQQISAVSPILLQSYTHINPDIDLIPYFISPKRSSRLKEYLIFLLPNCSADPYMYLQRLPFLYS